MTTLINEKYPWCKELYHNDMIALHDNFLEIIFICVDHLAIDLE